MYEKSMSGLGMRFLILALCIGLFTPLFSSAASCPNLTRNLSFGSRGSDVKSLQVFLIAERDLAAGNNTGYYGRLTESAVKKWQARNGVVSKGTPSTTGFGAVGPRTRTAIARLCGRGINPTPAPPSPPTPTPNPNPLPTPPSPQPSPQPPGNVVTRPQTNCTISVTPSTIIQGESATLAWTSTNATSSTIDHGIGPVGPNGSKQITPTSATFTLTARGVSGEASCSATIAVAPASVDENVLFPTIASITPSGYTYYDAVPATLDLASRATEWIVGTLKSHIDSLNPWRQNPSDWTRVWMPAGTVNLHTNAIFDVTAADQCNGPVPCITDNGSGSGAPNWGGVGIALFEAREMGGYDIQNALGTLTEQRKSILNMIHVSANGYYVARGGGPIPLSESMTALVTRYKQAPNDQLRAAVNMLARMLRNTTQTDVQNGHTFYYFYQDDKPFGADWWGYGGYMDSAFIQGEIGFALGDACNATGDAVACDLMAKLNDYLRNYKNGILWRNPDPSRFSWGQPGQFAGHTYSYLQPALSFIEEAKALRSSNPSLAQEDLTRARDIYEFTKSVTKGSVVGDFGDTGTTAVMVRIAISLSQAGLGPYWEDAERWTRNQLAESQIDDTVAAYIPNTASSNPNFDHIADKVRGLFLADATHVFSIPLGVLRYTNDEQHSSMQGLYAVWRAALDVQGSTARVNFLLNRAGPYFDVKSDIPYRGRIELDMKTSIGPIQRVSVRIPSWTDQAAVAISRYDASGALVPLAKGSDWSLSGSFATILNVQPSSAYILTFPMTSLKTQVTTLRNMNQWWYEGNYPALCGENTGTCGAEHLNAYTVTLLGDTVVDVSPRPSIGVPRYLRDELAKLVHSDDTVTEITPPQISQERFSSSGKAPVQVLVSTSPAVSFTVDKTTVDPGTTVNITWTSQNVSSCAMSYTYADGSPGGSFPIPLSGTRTPGVNKTITYTVTCTAGSPVSKSVTIAVAPAALSCTISANPATIAAGQSTTLSWNSTGATSASMNGDIGAVALNGSLESRPTPFTFVLTVTGPSGSNTCSATVTVTP